MQRSNLEVDAKLEPCFQAVCVFKKYSWIAETVQESKRWSQQDSYLCGIINDQIKALPHLDCVTGSVCERGSFHLSGCGSA